MPDWRKMYIELFHEVSKVIEILEKAQCDAEETYMTSPEFVLLPQPGQEVENEPAETSQV